MKNCDTIPKEQVKAILFDFDDTLGNRETYSHRTYEKLVDEIAPNLDPWEREILIQQCLIYEQYGDVDKSYVRNRVLEVFGIDLGEGLSQYWTDHQWESVVLYDDAIPVIEELKKRGYRIGIITNGNARGQRPKIEKSGVLPYLDVLVISGDADVKKPDPRIFKLAADQLGLAVQECAFVGDMMRNDMYGAYRAGMVPIWIWPHNRDRYSEVKVARIETLTDLLSLFAGVRTKI